MIYKNIMFQEYLAIPAMNASKLKPYSISPRFGWFKEHKDFKRSMAMSVGSLVHALVLEGENAYQELISTKYITSGFPVNEKTGKPFGETSGKYTAWLEDQPAHKEVIFPELLESTVGKVARAVAAHGPSRDVLLASNYRETAVTWTCQFTGIECKALIDFYGADFGGDLKTFGKQLTFHNMEREIFDRQYHMQFAFYQDGMRANDIPCDDFYVIFAQNKDDYDVGCFMIDEPTLEQGQADYLKAIANYHIAKEDKSEFKAGSFPKIVDIGIPHYHLDEAPTVQSLGLDFGE